MESNYFVASAHCTTYRHTSTYCISHSNYCIRIYRLAESNYSVSTQLYAIEPLCVCICEKITCEDHDHDSHSPIFISHLNRIQHQNKPNMWCTMHSCTMSYMHFAFSIGLIQMYIFHYNEKSKAFALRLFGQ